MKKINTAIGICFLFTWNILSAQNVGVGTLSPLGKLHIKGAADASQLIIDGHSTQENTSPLIKLRNSIGTDLMWIHSDNIYNTFLGLNAGRVNDATGGGQYNTFIGRDAGYSNTTGNSNTANGMSALRTNSTGNFNTAIGKDAMYSNTTGYDNTTLGRGALYFNTTGYSNTASGNYALRNTTTGYYNSAHGSNALRSNTTGFNNTSNGYFALYSNTTGNWNTATGANALYTNTTGYHNMANGHLALNFNTAGNNNSATGNYALYSNTTASNNTAHGYAALYANTAGASNTANGHSALYANTTGFNNTSVGFEALNTTTTGNNNTAIGYAADVSGIDISNATAIGSKAYAGASNSVVIGSINGVNGAAETVNVGIGTTAPNPSSALDVSSTTKGFLPPRMSESQRNSIGSPAEGLVIWCTNCGVYGQVQVHNGLAWTNILGGPPSGIPVIGDREGGGVVAYVLQPGDPGYVAGENHGLIAALSDQDTTLQWGCVGTIIPGADGLALGTGYQNTIDIVNGCAMSGIAARICNDLVLEGYSDWFLPSQDELHKLYLNQVAIGGFISGSGYDRYWSSSEFNSNYAWHQEFSTGNKIPYGEKEFSYFYVRAVRAF